MTWTSLHSVRLCTVLEGARSVQAHYFVRLSSGLWTRTYGPPKGCTHVRGRVYRTATPD